MTIRAWSSRTGDCLCCYPKTEERVPSPTKPRLNQHQHQHQRSPSPHVKSPRNTNSHSSQTLKLVASPPQKHTNFIKCILALNNRTFVSGSLDKDARCWRAIGGECTGLFRGHEKGVVGLTRLDDYGFVTACIDGTARRWVVSWLGRAG
mmetsp:Transcript_35269/g.40796  ORF Transcript_35269/g.40796 Transcript_35269/m.40796 type:complete len:149 (-) Transcript_35269:71-517(-)